MYLIVKIANHINRLAVYAKLLKTRKFSNLAHKKYNDISLCF